MRERDERNRKLADEYEEKASGLLSAIPKELHAPLRSLAWDEGHSSGVEECLGYLAHWASELEAPCKALVERVRREATAKGWRS